MAIGAVGASLGARGYLDSRAEFLFRWWIQPQHSKLGTSPGGPALFVFDGVGLILVAVALAIGRNAFTVALVWAGRGVILVGLVLYVVHPGWAEPRWMRNRPG